MMQVSFVKQRELCILKPARAIAVCLLLVLLLSTVSSAYGRPGDILLYRWIDELGKVHYTESIEDIPAKYRASAVRGTFSPGGGAATPTPTPTPTPKPGNSAQLELLDDSYYVEDGFLHIKGKVRNGFSDPVAQGKVKVTFYDAQNRFLIAETTLINPIYLAPDQVGTFHLIIKVNPNIDTYKIEPQGNP